MTKRTWLGALCAAALAAGGCDSNAAGPGPGPGPEPGRPGLRLVSGQAGTDSVDANLPQPLVVEVRDSSGALATNALVLVGVRNAQVARAGQGFSAVIDLLTDAQGRASMQVRLGPDAGSATVTVGAFPAGYPGVSPAGYGDSARYTVTPGLPARVAAAPADSAVYVGSGYALRATVRDRHGNLRPETPEYSTGSAHVSVAAGAVRGESVGRGYVLARYGGLTDTAWVSVVPPGVLAAYEPPGFSENNGVPTLRAGRIVSLNTDGSGLRVLLEQQPAVNTISYAEGMLPSWAPSGGDIAYVNGGRLMLLTEAGATREVLGGGEPVHAEFTPQFSADGVWIYFTRGRDGNQRTFWRVHSDGTGARQVSPALDFGIEVSPFPDPAGDRVAYQTNRATNSTAAYSIRTLQVSTGAVNAIDVPGIYPHWSPDGAWIAYLENENPTLLHLVKPDGTGGRRVGAGVGAYPAFSWSPDGQWLVISGSQSRDSRPFAVGLSLVNVSTGEVLPLTFDRDLVQPSWRR